MTLLTRYETPLWTLIGVAVGFALSWLYSACSRRREYGRRITHAIERIKGGMHLKGARLGPERISDLLPQFEEKDQLEILGQVSLESSLSASTDQVTHYILDELRWHCVVYELFPQHTFTKRSRRDERRVVTIQSWIAEIGANIVEYRQSEPLLREVFALNNILQSYAIKQRYSGVVTRQIDMYRHLAKLSVGIMYSVEGYKVLNFQYGIHEALARLGDVKEQVRRSNLSIKVRDRLLAQCEAATRSIVDEQARHHV
jgi:hypothetical protein